MLTEVHRQAQDDPIVRLSMLVREGKRLEPGRYGETEIVLRDEFDPDRVQEADQILVGRNNHAPRLQHAAARTARPRGRPARRGRQARVSAQQPPQGTVQWRAVDREGAQPPENPAAILTMRLMPDADLSGAALGVKGIKVSVRRECFLGGIENFDWPQRKKYDEFDYGYVLTVHKAQGSQWDDVVLFDESFAFPDSRERWLYTGITRAAKKLTLVVS